MEQLTKEQAIKFYERGEWKEWTDKEIVDFQLFQEKLCLPFGTFHKAVEGVLGRGVWTSEFVHPELLNAEYKKKSQ